MTMLVQILHPGLAEVRIALPRRLVTQWPRVIAGLMLVAAVCMLVVTATGAGAWVSVAVAFGFNAISHWPLPVMLLIAAAGYAVTRGRLLLLLDDWQGGWLAATPVAPRCLVLTSLAIVAVGTILATIMMMGVFTLAAAFADSGAHLRNAQLVAATGIMAGATLGLLSALRNRRNSGAQAAREGFRQPLLSLRALWDRRLPHLLDWQRREALLRWRRGGNFRWVGAVLFALPSGISGRTAVALLLLAVSIAWFIVTIQACHHSTRQAKTLCSGTPVPGDQFAFAALRYPTFAVVCTLVIGAIAIAIGGFPWRALSVLLACILLFSVRMLALLLSSSRESDLTS